MKTINKNAFAKINLGLEITGKRSDGYHEIVTVFARVGLCDNITVSEKHKPGLRFNCNYEALSNENNIICKAYDLFCKKTGINHGMQVFLEKRIPYMAGLGGGSADAAAFLKCCQELYGTTDNVINDIASELGSDINACLIDSYSFGTGRGETVFPIDSNITFYVIIIKPLLDCPTGRMYNAIDSTGSFSDGRKTQLLSEALKESDKQRVLEYINNDFEKVVSDDIISLKQKLIDVGAVSSLLSGSGACVFGLFLSEDDAKNAYKSILSDEYEAWITKTM